MLDLNKTYLSLHYKPSKGGAQVSLLISNRERRVLDQRSFTTLDVSPLLQHYDVENLTEERTVMLARRLPEILDIDMRVLEWFRFVSPEFLRVLKHALRISREGNTDPNEGSYISFGNMLSSCFPYYLQPHFVTLQSQDNVSEVLAQGPEKFRQVLLAQPEKPLSLKGEKWEKFKRGRDKRLERDITPEVWQRFRLVLSEGHQEFLQQTAERFLNMAEVEK